MANRSAFEALVLAAGSGSRFGGEKLLAPYKDGLLLDAALAAAFAAPARRVTVVTGSGGEAVAAAAQAFDSRVRIVHAVAYREGIAASLRAGITSLPDSATGAFVFLGDMPRVPHGVSAQLADAIAGGAAAAAPVWQGRRGHPVLLARELFGKLLALSGDEGARHVIPGLGERLALVEAQDDGVLFDVDEPRDLTGTDTAM